ncbi:hypothetical protein CYLTODRAFT_421362 [Cylindrobasidium torrendii FP15055 ss-10]|uniref:DUF1996 domain-containing protein n=1 Tax=Cylindrobasidium torrendii FP15055 ss-10 TaxID=1314674 RepID=A0A0D7BE15_9AGAR|nr:hypothetical protein CYLTODRAFT_421362 [Cylindrobasidium torrendii FP15055 ss-10]
MKSALFLAALSASVNAYWLMAVDDLFDGVPQRVDPLVYPGQRAGHVHKILGGKNFDFEVPTSDVLRQSECTTTPIAEDHSNYWVPSLYFQWANGSYSSVGGGAVIYYLFPDTAGSTTPFPDDFRMLSGDPSLRSFNESSFAQQAVTYLCLNWDAGGETTRHNEIPVKDCPAGIRSQINFPSCWDGKNTDSADHKSHVAFRSGGPDSGDCTDPNFPVSIPRIFIEIYWSAQDFTTFKSQAKNPSQPFVLSNGDELGYSYHGDFLNGWETATLQKAVDQCNCNMYGDPTCCGDAGVFTYDPDHKNGKCTKDLLITDEPSTGLIAALPGVDASNLSTSASEDASSSTSASAAAASSAAPSSLNNASASSGDSGSREASSSRCSTIKREERDVKRHARTHHRRRDFTFGSL